MVEHRPYPTKVPPKVWLVRYIRVALDLGRQSSGQAGDEVPFPKILSDLGIIPGIKVDEGTVDLENFPGEKITEGLDGLKDRLMEYKEMGAKFTKWRAVITIGDNIPSDVCIGLNIENLVRFASISQESGMVPIVEPEFLMDGGHDLEKCRLVTYKVLKTLFTELTEHKVELGGLLLKPNMIIQGKDNPNKANEYDIAKNTLDCFKEVVPREVSGIVFLSGGISPSEAT